MYNKGVFDGTSSPLMYNSILWNNQDNAGVSTLLTNIYNEDASIFVYHSLLQGSGGSDNWTLANGFSDGGDNIDQDPKFITPVDATSAPTKEGYLRLGSSSPAIDAGDNSVVPTGVLTDIEGYARIADGNFDGTKTVDMGAFENQIDYYLTLVIR